MKSSTIEYRIYVADADGDIFYFGDSIKFEGAFVLFEPKAMLVSSEFQDQLHDQVLTFPSQSVWKITYHKTNPQEASLSKVQRSHRKELTFSEALHVSLD